MLNIDLTYLANSLANLSGVPVRIYKNSKQIYFSSIIPLIKDPAQLIQDDLLTKTNDIGYITTPDFFYYGYVRYKSNLLVIGPSRLIAPDNTTLNNLAFELGIEKDFLDEFINAMKSIITMPLESILESLIMFNYILNNKKISLKEILINDKEASNMNDNIYNEIANIKTTQPTTAQHNTIDIENNLCKLVERGDIDNLNNWLKNAPSIRPGVLSNDSLRQAKNTFIVAATLMSRAAIKGMLDQDEALSLSDLYIQKMELLNNESKIYTLQMNMVIDFTKRVAKIKNKTNSVFISELTKYVLNNLNTHIKSKDICSSLYTSKSVLFERVKKETNMTLSEFILSIKINESKNILKYSNKSISFISGYLGFSSSSHFNRVFKYFTNITPLEYRKTHAK